MEVGRPYNLSLQTILKQIDNGTIKLPEFQRDFRWEIGDVIDLIISLLRGFPAGVLLFWNVLDKKDKLAERPFEGVNNLSSNTKYLVLDGQQRLTSLYQLFYKDFVILKGGRVRKFFINLDKLRNQDYDECIEYFSQREMERQKLGDINTQVSRNLLPFNILINEDKLREWKNEYVKRQASSKNIEEIQTLTNKFEKDFFDDGKPLNNLKAYEFPILELPSALSLEAVTTIFEKLNTAGQPLNVFEILTAKFYQTLNLRKLWKNAKEAKPIIKEYTKDEKDTTLPILILKAILIKKSLDDSNSKTLECKRKNLLEDLQASDIQKYWDNIVEAFETSLNKLYNDYGSPSIDYLPYTTMLTPFALILNYIEEKVEVTKKADAFRKLEIWYWVSVFSGRYDSATDTKTKIDVDQVINWIENNVEPSFIKEFKSATLNFDEITSGARYKGILAMMIKNGCRDLCTKEEIATLIKNNPKRVDIHHVFPERFLEKRYGEESKQYKMKDTILNKIIIRSETNQKYISDDPPGIYLQNIQRFNPDLDEDLKKHLLPVDSLKKNEFDEFLKQRKQLLLSHIDKLTKQST
ncbi:MAG: GmrSD restriction endonuclease domain-containing protein [Thermoproteota archaeon]